jgi:hypothetical protein
MTAIVSAHRKRPFVLPFNMRELFVPFLKNLEEGDTEIDEIREWIELEENKVSAVIFEPQGNSKWHPELVAANQNFWLRIHGKVNGSVGDDTAIVVQIERPLAGLLGQEPILNVRADLEVEGRFTAKVSMSLPGFGSLCKVRFWVSMMSVTDGSVTIISKPIEYWFKMF